MAHIAKYKAASCGHMLAHYRRDASSLGRENIDPTRTKGNYTLGLDDRDGKVRAMNGIEPNWATVEGRAERGAILDSIAARCAGAARAARAAIEELGDRIWALMRPKKTQRTERNLDDVMREATEVARAAKALSRNHVAPTNNRPRGQAR